MALAPPHLGHGSTQGLSVGMARGIENRRTRAALHDDAEIHHRHPVGDEVDYRQVVGDKQHGEPAVADEIVQQVEYLALDRDIES